MKKYIISGLLLALFVVAPVWAQTTTTSTTATGLIAQLRAQIAQLTSQLNELVQRERQSLCFNFTRDFRGDDASHPEWTKLGQVLKLEGVSTVKELQEKYADDILRPAGLRLGTGYVGVNTRALLNRLYKCKQPINDQAPVISGISGPTSLKVGETGTWTIKASDPNNKALTYSVSWGDSVAANTTSGASDVSSSASQQTTTFTHVYNYASSFRPQFTVTNSSGQSAQTSISVNVVSTNQPAVTVISPNGEEWWQTGTVHQVVWKLADNHKSNAKVDLFLDYNYVPINCGAANNCVQPVVRAPYVLDKNIAWNATYNWIAGTDVNDDHVISDKYYLRVCLAGTDTCDSSDKPFTVSTGSGV